MYPIHITKMTLRVPLLQGHKFSSQLIGLQKSRKAMKKLCVFLFFVLVKQNKTNTVKLYLIYFVF